MPKEWSWLTGHLLTLQKYVDQLPPDANVNLAMRDLAMEYADTEVFLMDFWPIYPPLLMVYNPEAAVQLTTKLNLPKTDMHLKFMKPITGGPNLISMNDQEWKTWRSFFNPGFSSTAMMDNMPHIVDSVQIFCDKLQGKVAGGLFCLDDLTTRLTMDIIIKLTLLVTFGLNSVLANHSLRDADLDYQRSENELATALGYITRWHSFWDPRILMHPLRPFVQKYYGRVMDKYIRKELDKRFIELKQEDLEGNNDAKSVLSKSVIAMAISAYINENKDSRLMQKPKLEEFFARYASYQIRLFLFAGNDTTSSSIVYVYHLLSKNPKALALLRQEHDSVFGTDLKQCASLLKEQPALLNACKYTLAVIKETLRLYPPAATMRAGRPGVTITDLQGNAYPMDNVGATVVHPAVHYNPRVWPQPNEFLPERFLVEPDHELYPNPGGYRPFEQGPRNCIGQTLVYNEMRTVLVMTARVFDIKPAYEEWDALQEKQMGLGAKILRLVTGPPMKTVHGDRAYQTEKAGTHPADGYPCRVSMAPGR
jgi:cytochrome P450